MLTWCFLCFVCFNPEDNHCVESQFRLFSCSVFCFTGEDLAQGVGFWYAFLTSFWGPKTMVLSKREGLLPGPGLALSFWFPFFLELWLLSSCCLGLFSGAILVAIPCLDTGWILAWSFGCLFCCCFGWPFRCCLGRCFALCFCVVGCLAPGLDPCMVVLVPVS